MTIATHFTDHASLYDVEHFDSIRELYPRLALPYVPRILHLLDREPLLLKLWMLRSCILALPHHGFPCGMSQEMVLLLALYLKTHTGNSFHQVSRISEPSEAAIRFMIKSSYKAAPATTTSPSREQWGPCIQFICSLGKLFGSGDGRSRNCRFFHQAVRHLEMKIETGRLGNHLHWRHWPLTMST